jgi:hypothetical protein
MTSAMLPMSIPANFQAMSEALFAKSSAARIRMVMATLNPKRAGVKKTLASPPRIEKNVRKSFGKHLVFDGLAQKEWNTH